jgi:hypothetical protein
MDVNPFSHLKIACLKATVRTVAHPSIYKPVLQIRRILLRLGFYFPDFGISGKVPWHIALCTAAVCPFSAALAVPAMVVPPLAYRSRHNAIC